MSTGVCHTLKSLRVALGMTIEVVAAKSRLDRRSILNLEAGRNVPSIEVAARHALALGISRDQYDEAFGIVRARHLAKAGAA